MPGASEPVVRQSARKAIDEFGKDGALIFWDGGIAGESEDSNNKRTWVYDELKRYGTEIYKINPIGKTELLAPEGVEQSVQRKEQLGNGTQ